MRDLRAAGQLRPTAPESRVRRALATWPQAAERSDALSNLVPSRFLGPWLQLNLAPAIRDERRTRAIIRMARDQLTQDDGPPYAIERGSHGGVIVFGPGWRDWLLNHRLILESHAELALVRFLQARNPHIPGIADKVRMPGHRKLAPAKRLFALVRANQGGLHDVYDGEALGDSFAVDHVLPRSFVAHDLLWNLVPAQVHVNRDKGEALPCPALLDAVAAFQWELVQAAPIGASELEDYLAVFGLDEHDLRRLSNADFADRYRALIDPLILIAAAQGFRSGWVPSATKA